MATDTSTGAATESADGPRESGPDPIIGKTIDGCRVERKIGQGGMGVVYLARHDELGQEFCIKILNPSLVGSEDTVERFFREAQACAQLNHPGIVAIQNVGQDGEYYFIRMEYVHGETLEDMVKEQKQVDWRDALGICLDTAESLAHAHQKGMIHRDIKPENVMRTPEGEVKVMDFGLAKHVHSSNRVSVTGQIVGTPFFMSPEQAGGKPTDARSDIYSLGVTLYYLVTGVKPFNGKNLQEIFLKHFFYAPESPKVYNEALPESLCEVVRKCLKKKKKERYQSAKALARDMRAILEDPETSAVGDGAPAVPESGDDDDGGKTVVAGGGGGDDDDGRTVRVGGDDGDLDEATVRVGGEAEGDDGEATVAVGGARKGGKPRGEVSSMQFRSASMVFDGDAEGATVRVSSEDEDDDDPTAGLDLPTVALPDGARKAQEKPEGPVGIGAGGGGSKKLLIVVGLLILIPVLLLGGKNWADSARFETLKQRYHEEVADSGDPELLEALAAELDEVGGEDATNLANLCRGKATQVRQTRKAEEDALAEQERQDRLRAEREAEVARLRGEAATDQEELEALKAAEDWPGYAASALEFWRSYHEVAELSEVVDAVRVPVEVRATPGAKVFLDGSTDPVGQTDARGEEIVWVKPNQPFKLRVELRGFDPADYVADATEFISWNAFLQREVLRRFSLGTVEVRIGARAVDEPLVPTDELQLDRSRGGTAYFVGHDGYLHAVNLDDGEAAWQLAPKQHRVGVYGDPTPRITLVPGRVIYAPSLEGTISAHDPSNSGQRIWTREVGAGLSSPAAYNPSNRTVAVGTSDGDVVFLSGDTGSEKWRLETGNAVVAEPYLQGESLAFVGSTDDRLYALDWREQRVIDQLELGDDILVGPRPLPGGRRALVATADGKLHLVDLRDPSRLRQVAALDVHGRIEGLTLTAERCYVSAGKILHAVEIEEAGLEERWAVPAEGTLCRPLVGDGVVYVGDAAGFLYAFAEADGVELWRFEAEAPVNVPPILLDDDLYAIAGNEVLVLAAN